ncbi:MAG: hypothetical protein RBT46_03850 [Weeksellaceae bacterium]|jgi:hypothetical protein|nr:hypothetical protein [Weeksellaceae bacterium]MDX9704824.1 hypothetical protein [Weeksellaceae bacterium]
MKKQLLFIFLFVFTSVFCQTKEFSSNNWRTGGGIGLNLGLGDEQYFGFNISPFLGYAFTPYMEAGITAGYQHSKWKNVKQNLFSGGPYVHFYPVETLFLRVHYEYFTGNSKVSFPSISSSHFSEDALWLGAGYRTTGTVQFYSGILYNVLYKENSRLFLNGFLPFAGIGFSL